MHKADLNLIKNAFKKGFYELYGVIDAQLSYSGEVLNVIYTPEWQLDETYTEELFTGLKQGLTGGYGKNFFDCSSAEVDVAEGANMLRMREVWEKVADARSEFTVENVKSIVDTVATNIIDFTSLKGDEPSNYLLHIGFFNINPTADNAKLANKKHKAESSEGNAGLMCYDLPIMFIWVDTYTNNYTTILEHNEEDKLERKSLAYIGKGKAPLFTAAYPNIVDDALDFDGIFLSCKTAYDRLLTAVGNTFMCDITTNPVNYARESVESIVTKMLGGVYTYDMYMTYTNELGNLYVNDKFGKLTADNLVTIIDAMVTAVGTGLTDNDIEQIKQMYSKFFGSKAPELCELIRDKHKVELPERNIELTVEADNTGCFGDNICIERRETEHGVEFWCAMKLSSIEEPMTINDVNVLLYADEEVSAAKTDECNETDNTLALETRMIDTFKTYLHKDNDTWESTNAATAIRKNATEAQNMYDEKIALCEIHTEILNANTDELTSNLTGDIEELAEKLEDNIETE